MSVTQQERKLKYSGGDNLVKYNKKKESGEEPETTLGKEVILTEDEIEDLIIHWQKYLKLEFWDINFRVCRRDELTLPDVQGTCKWTLSTAIAYISLIDPVDYPTGGTKYDMEHCLVHEILHLHFAPFSCSIENEVEQAMQERAIDHIAKALVKLRREAGNK